MVVGRGSQSREGSSLKVRQLGLVTSDFFPPLRQPSGTKHAGNSKGSMVPTVSNFKASGMVWCV